MKSYLYHFNSVDNAEKYLLREGFSNVNTSRFEKGDIQAWVCPLWDGLDGWETYDVKDKLLYSKNKPENAKFCRRVNTLRSIGAHITFSKPELSTQYPGNV